MTACASVAYIVVINLFFQAEDGIRYGHVTGVQTCALPISPKTNSPLQAAMTSARNSSAPETAVAPTAVRAAVSPSTSAIPARSRRRTGRASTDREAPRASTGEARPAERAAGIAARTAQSTERATQAASPSGLTS